MCKAKVHIMSNMTGIMMFSRIMLHSNWASMTVQMLARYAQRWCIALMTVLVVMVVQALLRISFALSSNSLASQSYMECLHSFGKGLGVQDKIEVVEMLFALTCEVDGHHCGDFIIAGCILGVDEWIMVRKVNFMM